tara:strand:- start:628 stop:2214 length:1587 start_codon:yes stop_codon:yes gene_type:complete
MKLATSHAQLIEMIREELALEQKQLYRIPGSENVRDDDGTRYRPSSEEYGKAYFGGTIESEDDATERWDTNIEANKSPAERVATAAADKLETAPGVAIAAGGVGTAAAGKGLEMAKGAGARHIAHRGTDAVTKAAAKAQAARDALPKTFKPGAQGARQLSPYKAAATELANTKGAAEDIARLRGAQIDDIEIPEKKVKGIGRDAYTKKGLRSRIADLDDVIKKDQKIIDVAKELGDDAPRKTKKAAEKAAKRTVRNRGAQVALRQGDNPLLRKALMRLAQSGGAAAVGAGLQALGAGITAAEVTDIVLGDNMLDVLPTWKGGKNISWTDAVNAENWKGLDPSSVRNRDRRSKKQATNPKKGYNKYYDPEGKGIDKYGRVKEGTNKMNNLDRIIEELITEEIEEHYNETNELGRWSELAGLSETSGMAAGSVGGAAGGSSPSFWGAFGPDRDNEDDELEEAQDNSFSEAGKEIEKKGTEGVFTAKAKKAGMGVQAYADKVLQKDSNASTKTKRQASFAKGAATVARENK